MSSFLGGGGGGSSGGRTILTGDTNYYIATTGSDSNDGSIGSPWATTQHAMSFIASSVDGAGFNVFVNIGAGTFQGFGVAPTTGINVMLWLGVGSTSTAITGGPNDGILNFGECVTFNFESPTIISIDLMYYKPAANNLVVGQYTPGTFLFLGNYLTFSGANLIDTVFSPGGLLLIENGGFCQTISTIIVLTNGASIPVGLDVASQAVLADGCSWRFLANTTADTYSTCFARARQSGIIQAVGFAAVPGEAQTGQRFQVEGASTITGGSQYGAAGPDYYTGTSPGTCDASSSYDGFPGPLPGIDTQTSGYTLAISDAYSIVEMNDALANTLTIPTNASVAFEIGTKIWITQIGAGITTIAGAGGVTVNNAGALTQWQTAKIYKRGTDEWTQTNA